MKTLLYPISRFILLFVFGVASLTANAQCPPGDVTLLTQAEVDAFALDYPGCTTIAGDLIIGPSSDINNLNALNSITQINQSLTIAGNENLTDMSGLSGLTSVYRSIVINNNPILASIDLESISGAIIGDFYVENNTALMTLAAPIDLSEIGNFAYIRNNPFLANLTGLENLTTIGRGLEISHTSEDVFPDFSSLTTANAGIRVSNCPNVTTLNFQNVDGTFYDSFVIVANESLETLNAPVNLTSVSNNIYIYGNPNLENLTGLGNVATIGRSLIINDVLEDNFPDFSNLTAAGAGIGIGNCPNVPTLNFQNVGGTFYDGFVIQNNASLVTLQAPELLTGVSNNIYITGNHALENLTGLEQVTTIGRSLIISNTLEDEFPDFSNLTSVGTTISINNNPNVTSLHFQNVSGTLTNTFGISFNPALETLYAPVSLTSVEKDLFVRNNTNLTTFTGLENVTYVGQYFELSLLPTTIFPDFSNLAHVGRWIRIVQNPNVTSINISGVEGSVGNNYNNDGIFIFRNDHLTSLYGPEPLTEVTGVVFIGYHSALTTFTGFGQLASIGKSLQLTANNASVFPDMHSLITIGENLDIIQNEQIEDLYWLQNLTTIGGNLRIQNNSVLSLCTINAVCDFLSGTGNRSVIGNTGCCLNEPILTDACNNVSSGTEEVCDGEDNDCDGLIDEGFDQDQDGYTTCQGDCDDTNAAINPGAEEICDGNDNNCNGTIDEGFDVDGDGFTSCGGDCDDNDPNNFPGNEETCDGSDNNCDGQIDEGYDADGDGLSDCLDNCPFTFNPGQTDSDCDGVGDGCDQWDGCDDSVDSDNDGTPDCIDTDEMDNWACGNKGNKVTICHIPPGNPGNRQTICISPNAVANHLDEHSDYIGECYQVSCGSGNLSPPIGNSVSRTSSTASFTLYPNPTRGTITLDFNHHEEQAVSIVVYNHLGQRVLAVTPQVIHDFTMELQLSAQLSNGIYYLHAITGGEQFVKPFVLAR